MPLNRKARFALPALIDREDEENIFFVLEELGLAHLQSMWIKSMNQSALERLQCMHRRLPFW